jgi:hypothetical protein
MVVSVDGGFKSRHCYFVLSVGLPHGGANDELEDLVFAVSRRAHRRNFAVGHPRGLRGHVMDQRSQRFGEIRFIESGSAM